MKSKTKRMDETCQILETYHACGYYKHTAKRLQVSKNTVKGYLQRAEAAFGTVAQVLATEEGSCTRRFPSLLPAMPAREQAFNAQLGHWSEELGKVGITRYLLWQEYRRSHPDGYGYTQFCERLRRHLQDKGLSMALSHKPGYAMYLDFAGKVMHWVSREDGHAHDCQVLVAVLPYSQYTFAIALPSQIVLDLAHGIT